MLFDPNGLPFWVIVGIVLAIGLVYMVRPLMSFAKFVYPNAKYEAIGNPFIYEKEVGSLAESSSLNTFVDQVNNSSKDYQLDGKTTFEVQQQLDENYVAVVEMMKKDTGKMLTPFFDAYLARSDVVLLKTELKKFVLGRKEEMNGDTAFRPRTKNLIEDLKTADSISTEDILLTYGFPQDIREAVNGGSADLKALDVALDKYMVQSLREVRLPKKSKAIRDQLLGIYIDVVNLKNILRGKQLELPVEECKLYRVGEGQEIASWKLDELCDLESVPQVVSALDGTSYFEFLKDDIEKYHREHSVQVFEDALDEKYLDLVKNLSMKNNLDIGPSLRFLISKEFENRNLKTIAKGVAEGVPSDDIKRLLIIDRGGM